MSTDEYMYDTANELVSYDTLKGGGYLSDGSDLILLDKQTNLCTI